MPDPAALHAFRAFKLDARAAVDAALARALDGFGDTALARVARYAVLGGGRRWRALTALAAGRAFDPQSEAACLAFAAAVELVHAASLVLDDRPSMDGAALRRGRPCAHLAFPDWAVDMLPGLLVSRAFGLIVDGSGAAPASPRVAAAAALARCCSRMAQGQELDLTHGGGPANAAALLECYRLKTGALFAAAAEGGALLAGADGAQAQALAACGEDLGMAFQLQDELDDTSASAEELRRDTSAFAQGLRRDTSAFAQGLRRDRSGEGGAGGRNRTAAVALFGPAWTRAESDEFTRRALARLAPFGPAAALLAAIVAAIGARERD